MSDDIFKARRQRARDIYDERGYTTRQFARLAGLGSHVEVMRYLNEKQPNNKEPKDITTPVLEKFLSAFKITLERFEKTDVIDLVSRLRTLLDSGKHPKEALRLAQEYASVAVGIKEKSEALGLLGKAYYEMNMYDDAHNTVKEAYDLALKGQDQELVYQATNKLLHSLFSKKLHTECIELLNEAESNFTDDIKKIGTFMHFRGMLANVEADYAASKDYFLRAYDLYKVLGDKSLIGRMEINLARHAYHDGDLEQARNLIISALENLQCDTVTMSITASQHLALIEIQQGNLDSACQIIDDNLRLIKDHNLEQPDLKGKLLMMKSDVSENTSYAEQALKIAGISEELRIGLIDFLTEKFIENGDRQVALKYYRLGKGTVKNTVSEYKKGRWF